MQENFSDFDLVEILIKYYKLKEILYQIQNTLIKYYKFKEILYQIQKTTIFGIIEIVSRSYR